MDLETSTARCRHYPRFTFILVLKALITEIFVRMLN